MRVLAVALADGALPACKWISLGCNRGDAGYVGRGALRVRPCVALGCNAGGSERRAGGWVGGRMGWGWGERASQGAPAE